ncbi:hypothetical protein B296_00001184 [Ensete ventricosum]|uniref:Uncharacterized protein n=1 Tax=Ensete ventricosum TaxID=4639 RepID=A0A427AB63_ENSVE|nr:hypothetical protein B296_00001184 [Ensete ventricosum]
MYRLVHTGSAADWYADRPLPGGTAKIDRRRSISAVDGRLKEKSIVGGRLNKKSIVGGRLRKKREEEKEEEEKKKEEEEKKKKEEEEKYLARVPSPSAGRPLAVTARGRLFSPRGETERLPCGERD